MFPKRIVCLLTALCCAAGICIGASALEVDCDDTYCFSADDFSSAEEPIAGICITHLPDPKTGTVMLGSRVLRSGDILTAEQVAQMTFLPLKTEEDQTAVVTFLPIYEDRVAPSTTMTISIRGKEDKAPVAENSALETYKNLPNEGALKVTDPEGGKLTYTVTRQPKRGQLEMREDGTFLYTPKKNKVGVDSFVYTAADPAGNVSREATVTVTVTKPTDAAQYTDTAGKSCRFAAEWMKNTGIFVSEAISGNRCFQPDKDVSRGEFLSMLVSVLELEPDTEVSAAGIGEEAPQWLKPYLAAAMRSGLLAGLPDVQTMDVNEPVTGAEAAVMLQNALDLSRVLDAEAALSTGEDLLPQWAAESVGILREHGISLDGESSLTRGDAAQIMYQVSCLAPEAPGTIALRLSK